MASKSEKIAAGKKRHGFTAVNKPRRGGPKKFEVLAVEGDNVTAVNKPRRGGPKKFEVLAVEGDNVKYVAFGDPNMEIRKDNPKARKSFRARHKCDEKKSKLTAGYWSCKKW